MGSQQTLGLQCGEHVPQISPAVLLFEIGGNHFVTGRDDDRACTNDGLLRLLQEVDCLGGACFLATSTEDTVIQIEQRNLWGRVGKGNVNGFADPEIALKFVRKLGVARVLAEAATGTLLLIHVTRLLDDGREKVSVFALNLTHLRVRHHSDVRMMLGFGHTGRADATAAVQCGEDLAEPDHLAADARLFLDDQYLEALICQVNCCLQAGDSAADYKSVNISHRVIHNQFL